MLQKWIPKFKTLVSMSLIIIRYSMKDYGGIVISEYYTLSIPYYSYIHVLCSYITYVNNLLPFILLNIENKNKIK